MFDGMSEGAQFAEIVRGYVERATAPLLKRIDELERRAPVAGKDGANGKDGRDAEPPTPEQIADQVRAWFDANPVQHGKDGRDGLDGKDGSDGKDGEPGERGLDGKDGRDGKDAEPSPVVAAAIKDHDGELVVTLTDGTLVKTGIYDGRDGKDGRDGLGFDDFVVEHDGERTTTWKFVCGDRVKEFSFVGRDLIYRGVFKDGGSYLPGDMVTWAGSLWHCDDETSDKPGEGAKCWTLAAKRGRDGKDAK